jgi:hypothetical protein
MRLRHSRIRSTAGDRSSRPTGRTEPADAKYPGLNDETPTPARRPTCHRVTTGSAEGRRPLRQVRALRMLRQLNFEQRSFRATDRTAGARRASPAMATPPTWRPRGRSRSTSWRGRRVRRPRDEVPVRFTNPVELPGGREDCGQLFRPPDVTANELVLSGLPPGIAPTHRRPPPVARSFRRGRDSRGPAPSGGPPRGRGSPPLGTAAERSDRTSPPCADHVGSVASGHPFGR